MYKSGIENMYRENSYKNEYDVDVESEDSCMATLFMGKGSSTVVCFSEYYPYTYDWTTLGSLPYCLKEGKYYWNINISEISIKDFRNTHGLGEKDPIQVCFYGLMGKGDFLANLYLHWQDFYKYAMKVYQDASPILDGISRIQTIITLGKFVNDIRKGFQKETRNKPHVEDFFNFLSQREKWNIEDLSKKTNLSQDMLEFIILAMGFDIQGENIIRNTKRLQMFKKEWVKYCNVDAFGVMDYCSLNTANVGVMYIYTNYPDNYQKTVQNIEQKLLGQDELYFDTYKREICFIKGENICNPKNEKANMALREINIGIELFLEEKENADLI